MSSFNLKNFWKFAASLKVDTKESDQITLAQENLLGTQTYMIEEIAKGIEEGVHHFVILKGRQLGITTISIALDLYWAMKHKGMSGSLVTHTEEAREMFRATITMYMESLPDEWRVPIVTHNRTQLVLKNRSRFSYQVAGTRKNSKLGKGQALTFLHATEVSEFGDEEGMASLEASLAENNPNRLFIYESTAQGMNHYVDQWENAKSATTQRAIFIGWWRHQGYRKKKGSQEYRVYWDGKLTHEERKWVTQVKKLYDFDIDDEQIAWWRWNLAEKTRDEQLLFQNFPPTEDYAFVMSGTNFFNPSRITDEYKVAVKIPVSNFRFVLRQNFEDTELTGCSDKMANLKIWDFPQHGGHYVIGADPAYGSSEWADRFCLSQDTELLTDFGWKKYTDIKIGDMASCFDLETGAYSFQPVQDVIIKQHDGEVIHFKTRSLDCICTPEHRVVAKIPENATGRRHHGKWQFRRADNLPRHFRVPLAGAECGEGIEGLSLDMCRLIGWIATDGHKPKRPEKKGTKKREWIGSISISQAITTVKRGVRICDEMKTQLMSMFGIKHSVKEAFVDERKDRNVNHAEAWFWRIPAKHTKEIMWWFDTEDVHRISQNIIRYASKAQLEALYLGLMEGDGTSLNGKWCKFYPGKCEGLADDLQQIALRLGYSATKVFVKSNEQWTVCIAYRETHYVRKREREHYKGDVWCITVPSGAFVARRNGTIFTTGNCASVFRCYSDGMEQVAEFNTADCSPYQFAWVVCYLAGAYMMNGASTCMLNLEINGPGQAVLTEMNQLKRVAANAKNGSSRGILDVVSNIQNFMYKRQDSFGAPSAYHTLTNTREKERMFNCFKDGFERGMIRVKSPGCIDEMKNIVREDGYLGAPGRGKDDRIVAAGLATVTWIDYVRIRMVQMQLSRENCMKRDSEGKAGGGTEKTVERYLKQIGVGQQMAR